MSINGRNSDYRNKEPLLAYGLSSRMFRINCIQRKVVSELFPSTLVKCPTDRVLMANLIVKYPQIKVT